MEMAKANANGWAVVCNSSSSPSTTNTTTVPIYSKYTRCTELRRIDDNDIYKLSTILDVNDCWRKLMSIIPKRLDAQACSGPGSLNYREIAATVGHKYTAQDINQIDGTAKLLTPGQSISQVMIDEWKTSGKLNERPTVGILLQLLVQAEIYSAADFVALHFLNEPLPERPNDGPAAHISLDLCSADLSEDMDVDDGASYQPNTSALNAAAAQARGTGMNLDYFEKHMVRRDKSVPQQLENGVSGRAVPPHVPIPMPVPVPLSVVGPVAPPRAARTSRQLRATASSASNTPNMPILSILNASSEQTEQPQNIPHLSILNGSSSSQLSGTTTTTTTTALDAAKTDGSSSNGSYSAGTSTATIPNVPLITLLIENSSCEIGNSDATETATATTTKSSAIPDMSYNNLPAISALNLNVASNAIESVNGSVAYDNNSENNSSGTNSFSNDDDDDDDDDDVDVDDDDEEADVSIPNLSNSDHHTSNNDSSLTTVTGTSGENSFELTNDSSSASNDEYTNNIPNLSELQQ